MCTRRCSPGAPPRPIFSTGIMSTACHTTASFSTFQSIFDAALKEYEKKTGKDLQTHPLAAELDQCNSPDAVLDILQKQADELDEIKERDQTSMGWLSPTIHVLYTLSATVGDVGMVSCSEVLPPIITILSTGFPSRECNNDWDRHPSWGNCRLCLP